MKSLLMFSLKSLTVFPIRCVYSVCTILFLIEILGQIFQLFLPVGELMILPSTFQSAFKYLFLPVPDQNLLKLEGISSETLGCEPDPRWGGFGSVAHFKAQVLWMFPCALHCTPISSRWRSRDLGTCLKWIMYGSVSKPETLSLSMLCSCNPGHLVCLLLTPSPAKADSCALPSCTLMLVHQDQGLKYRRLGESLL